MASENTEEYLEPPRKLASHPDRELIRERCTYPGAGYKPPGLPSQDFVWKFEDTFGNQFGRWFYRKSDQSASQPWTDVFERQVHQDGFLTGRDFAVCTVADEDGFRLYRVRPPAPAEEIYRQTEKLQIAALSADERYLLVRSSRGDDWCLPQLVVMDLSGRIHARLSDVDGVPGVWAGPFAWAPVPGDARVLVTHEATGWGQPAIWYPFENRIEPRTVDMPGEFGQTTQQIGGVSWDRTGRKLLLRRSWEGRSDLHRMDLRTGDLECLQPCDGSVLFLHQDEENQAVGVWAANHAYAQQFREKKRLPNDAFKPSRPLHRWRFRRVAGVPCLMAGGGSVVGPNWTFFDIYGMPGHHLFDGFDPGVASLVDHGIQVVSVNPRGCSGYGRAWREGSRGDNGFIQLNDLDKVRAQLIEEGGVDPQRTIVGGHSFGGYLTLLAMGIQPDRWAMGVAGAPVGDYVHCSQEASPTVMGITRGFLGGHPKTHPEIYQRVSPLTYVNKIKAPIHIAAGKADLLCPPQQTLNFVDALRERGGECEIEWFKGAHAPVDAEARVAWQTGRIGFILRQCRKMDQRSAKRFEP